jgi:tRNA modification GTPase
LHDLSRHGGAHTPEEIAQHQAADAEIARALAQKMPRGTVVMDVWNKADIALDSPARVTAGASGLQISAKTGAGLDALRQGLLQLVGWQWAPEGLYMARERHVQALRHVQATLDTAQQQLQARQPALDLLAEDLRQAQRHLSEITGEFTPDDLLGEIFSKFCIGK